MNESELETMVEFTYGPITALLVQWQMFWSNIKAKQEIQYYVAYQTIAICVACVETAMNFHMQS